MKIHRNCKNDINYIRTVSLDDILLYDIIIKKDNIIVLNKIDVNIKESSLESLKYAHQANYMIVGQSAFKTDIVFITLKLGSSCDRHTYRSRF